MTRWRLLDGARTGLCLLALLCMVAGPASSQAPAAAPARQTLRVLFIGNSYTYYNNLGDLVAGISAGLPGAPIIQPTLVTRGGATLQGHLESGSARGVLAAGPWDFVILQEQSLLGGGVVEGKAAVGNPAAFHRAVREWVRQIRAVGATPILFLTWARREGPADSEALQQRLTDAYLSIGRELGVTVAPAGLAWAQVRQELPGVELFVEDGSHPAPAGSYLAALVIHATLTGGSPIGAVAAVLGHPVMDGSGEARVDSTRRVTLVDLPAATARQLQDVAWRTYTSRPR